MSSTTARWIAVSVFVCSAILNYLDRQVLATMVDIWRSRPDFPFTYSDYGILLSVFSLAYALSAPFMGWFLDRVGLNLGITISVLVWSLASFGTGSALDRHVAEGVPPTTAACCRTGRSSSTAPGRARQLAGFPASRVSAAAGPPLPASPGVTYLPRFVCR